MEGDHDETPFGLEDALSRGKPACQFGKLVVDENSQRLESARGGMDHAFARMHDAADHLCERLRRGKRLRFARLHDRARNRTRETLFAKGTDDGGEIARACASNNIGHVRASASHSHIEWSVEP